jgi:hypothetical protein
MDKEDDRTSFAVATGELRDIEPAAFATLGNDVVAYLKPAVAQGNPGWEVHAADGRVLAVIQGSHETALAIVRQNDLEPLSLH